MLDKVVRDRQAKLARIRALGLDPYGRRYDSAEAIASILTRYRQWEAKRRPEGPLSGAGAAAAEPPKVEPALRQAQGEAELPRADAAGRIVLYRAMGKLIFAHLRDQSGSMQLALRKDALDEKTWELAAKCLDLGDIVAAEGPVTKTRTGEITIFAERLTLLCKSLLPMPEKYHGLVDVETRYRQRYLDLMANDEAMQVAQQRVRIVEHFRAVLRGRGFAEVETPILQPIYGGGAARPFTTHHNTLDADLYLRISPELYLKRLLVGGMEKVFEIGRNFRNEGIDTRHNPEFTMLELYQAYADYEVMMDITEELVTTSAQRYAEAGSVLAQAHAIEADWKERVSLDPEDEASINELLDVGRRRLRNNNESLELAQLVEKKRQLLGQQPPAAWNASLVRACFDAFRLIAEGKTALPYGNRSIDYTRPWRRATYDDLMLQHAGVSMRDAAGARKKARELGMEESNKDDAVVVNAVFEALVVPALAKPDADGVLRPVFVKDYPADICPLTRRKLDDPTVALRFECFIAGMEIANAYTELNDPAVQEANFRQQVRGEGEAAAMRQMDEDFLTALRQGMPPAGGLGIGIDRVVMLLTGRTSIRDVVLFPMLRREA